MFRCDRHGAVVVYMSPLPPTKNCARLRTTTHDYAQQSTMVDFIVSSIQLVVMVLGVSYSRVIRSCSCCSYLRGNREAWRCLFFISFPMCRGDTGQLSLLYAATFVIVFHWSPSLPCSLHFSSSSAFLRPVFTQSTTLAVVFLDIINRVQS